MNKIIFLIAVTLISGCSSFSKLSNSSGNFSTGGYCDTNIGEGIHYIYVKSGFSPWPQTSNVKENWEKRANELCGPQYTQINKVNSNYYMNNLVFFIISEQSGIIKCNNSPLSKVDTDKLVQEYNYFCQ